MTLFELRFDGTTVDTPSVGEAIDAGGVTDPDRMVTDPDRMVEGGDEGTTDVETDARSPSRGLRVLGGVALVAAAVAIRAMYRRRSGKEGAAVETVDEESTDGEAEPVEQ